MPYETPSGRMTMVCMGRPSALYEPPCWPTPFTTTTIVFLLPDPEDAWLPLYAGEMVMWPVGGLGCAVKVTGMVMVWRWPPDGSVMTWPCVTPPTELPPPPPYAPRRGGCTPPWLPAEDAAPLLEPLLEPLLP